MTERWALAPAEDGGVEIAALGPDGLPTGRSAGRRTSRRPYGPGRT